jgi:MarR family transcriptional regulator, organic hydroperoxide resistance regulator
VDRPPFDAGALVLPDVLQFM